MGERQGRAATPATRGLHPTPGRPGRPLPRAGRGTRATRAHPPPRPPRPRPPPRLPPPTTAPAPAPAAPATAVPAPAVEAAPTRPASRPATASGRARTSPPSGPGRPGRPVGKAAAAGRAAAPAPADPRFANGPLAVLDGDGIAHLVDGRTLRCPDTALPELVRWALEETTALGAPRLHPHGRDADPLLVVTEAAAGRLGLPSVLADRRGLRLPEDHKAVKQLARAKWQLTRRGFGPWARVYRAADGRRRLCVQLAVLPWGALDERAWPAAGTLPAPDLARALGAYAARVLTPCGSTAVTGLELMTALRPPTRPVRDRATGAWTSGPVTGSLTAPVDPAPCEAPDEHPVAAGRSEAEVLDEEAYEWIREPGLLSDAECLEPFAVGLDVNAAFLAAASRLTVGLGAPLHVHRPVFDRKTPGAWYADLSGIDLDPRLPSPFTPHGRRPEGPAWYATPTLAYAVELGADVRPLQAWIRPEAGPYLDPWYDRLRAAYLATMADLGVTPDLEPGAFLAAMRTHKQSDPVAAAVLAAIKATVKGGIGKLRERPQGAGYRPGQRWSALERPTWRPDIRAAVIAAARTGMHRKMRRLAETAGLFPLAVLSDCVVYPSSGPSPLDLLPHTPDGRPLPGTFRLGVSPGMVKHEGTGPMLWAVDLLENGHNPARHIKDGTV
ncbi:telomere-associated protein Tap [Streptomyces thermolineatus]|uniref:telomere-associated protein Tap n=1 Tax=Streptomyces thermolineatus TaxID=44033 RepID=UPI00384A785B